MINHRANIGISLRKTRKNWEKCRIVSISA